MVELLELIIGYFLLANPATKVLSVTVLMGYFTLLRAREPSGNQLQL